MQSDPCFPKRNPLFSEFFHPFGNEFQDSGEKKSNFIISNLIFKFRLFLLE